MPQETLKRILILGSTAPEVAKTLASIRASRKDKIDLLGYLDDDRSRWGRLFLGQPVLGGSELLRGAHRDGCKMSEWSGLGGLGSNLGVCFIVTSLEICHSFFDCSATPSSNTDHLCSFATDSN